MSYRNSRIYRLISRLVNPVTKMFHPAYAADSELQTHSVKLNSQCVKNNWKWYQPELVSSSHSEQGLVLECRTESVWYQNRRGPMLYRYVAGDGSVSLTVKTCKSSDNTKFPDSQWQFAGVMFRDPSGDSVFSRENYVFNAVGFRATGLQIETKSTRQGWSKVSASDWDSGNAELLLERHGADFILKARPVGSSKWLEMSRHNRPDFPAVMQLGLIVYAYSEGRGIVDLQAEFSDFSYTAE